MPDEAAPGRHGHDVDDRSLGELMANAHGAWKGAGTFRADPDSEESRYAVEGRTRRQKGSTDRLSKLLTVDDLVRLMSVSADWIQQEAKSGALPSLLIDGHLRFRRSSVHNYILDHEHRGDARRTGPRELEAAPEHRPEQLEIDDRTPSRNRVAA